MPAGECPTVSRPSSCLGSSSHRARITSDDTTSSGRRKLKRHHVVAALQGVHRTSYLNDFTHELVPKDITLLHGRNLAIIEMQIGAADRLSCHPYNGVARVQNLRIGHLFYPDHVLSISPNPVPNQPSGRASHAPLSFWKPACCHPLSCRDSGGCICVPTSMLCFSCSPSPYPAHGLSIFIFLPKACHVTDRHALA
jgi:hypothetical protein